MKSETDPQNLRIKSSADSRFISDIEHRRPDLTASVRKLSAASIVNAILEVRVIEFVNVPKEEISKLFLGHVNTVRVVASNALLDVLLSESRKELE